LLNALTGVLRALARKRTAEDRTDALSRMQRGAAGLALRIIERTAALVGPTGRAAASRPRAGRRGPTRARRDPTRARPTFSIGTARARRAFASRLASGAVLPIGVALVVLLASIVSLGPAPSVSAAQGGDAQVRIEIGGGYDPVEVAGLLGGPAVKSGSSSVDSLLDDGTLWKPVSVDTFIQDGRALLRYYKVEAGDTLTSIASRYGVSMMTIWWANKLTSKTLKVGSTLEIPPATGLMVTVRVGDTLDGLATKYKTDGPAILSANALTDSTLIIGQRLLIPNAVGAPIPTVKKTTYARGTWTWPIQGARNYISQYFQYGHYAIDIAAPTGSSIVSPLAGTIVFAAWKSGGGGYQVYVNHGNGIYSTHLHMSKILVVVGQHVAQGQRIGLVGMTGTATGPHDHFAVSIGFPYKPGSYFVNPLRYY